MSGRNLPAKRFEFLGRLTGISYAGGLSVLHPEKQVQHQVPQTESSSRRRLWSLWSWLGSLVGATRWRCTAHPGLPKAGKINVTAHIEPGEADDGRNRVLATGLAFVQKIGWHPALARALGEVEVLDTSVRVVDAPLALVVLRADCSLNGVKFGYLDVECAEELRSLRVG
ncbi:hypothetical protein HG530_012653 [Fusarium avenaceum]|nr:hypothetical protein HG530_012653 [Fusarium avenaceum]